ncbi:hypothetical protein [Malonomonas rubra]|uniref:hypothetical protein n=1 Tax=Malonomonas rubra TaxID=57040 RepID=UPI0026EF9039|nr:hypothetical protein [Malonomonas rubra]
MVIEITETTLRRLVNYEAVVQKKYDDAVKLQWQVMTLEVMQAAQTAEIRARQMSAVVAYARYLHRIQFGQDTTRPIYGEPLLSKALAAILEELFIESKLVPELST